MNGWLRRGQTVRERFGTTWRTGTIVGFTPSGRLRVQWWGNGRYRLTCVAPNAVEVV